MSSRLSLFLTVSNLFLRFFVQKLNRVREFSWMFFQPLKLRSYLLMRLRFSLN